MRISLNITKKCNLRCKHCFSNSGDFDLNELTTEELFKLIDQMKDAGSFFLIIGGGEPLLRDDLFQIIKYARENFISVSIVTNGLLINKEIAKKFNELNLNTMTISIDGLEKTHNQLRGKDTFKKIINKIKILRKYCQTTTIAIRVTINSLNFNEYKELIKLAEKLSLDLIRFTPILLFGRTKDNQSLLINQNKYIHFLENIRDIKSRIKLDFPRKDSIVHPGEFGCHCGNEICNNCSEYKKCRGGCRARALSEYKDINAIDPFCPLKKNKSKFIKSKS